MTFSEKYSEEPKLAEPCQVVKDIIDLKDAIPDVEPILADCEFSDCTELATAYAAAWWRVATDTWLNTKETQKTVPNAKILLQRANRITTAADAPKRIAAAAEGMWLRRFERIELERRRNAVFSGERSQDVYLYACDRIRSIYGFNDTEMEAMRYFVCQARRDNSDPALNRALYIHSAEKMTGKTTVAKIVAGILNGCASWREVQRGAFLSDIPTELQFSNFERPKATRYACVVMDEAFAGKTTAKYYGKFKTAMTSDMCSVEVKFGSKFDIPCARNYIFTSNNDISSVVADESERRMAVIEMRKPKEMEYTALYDLWRDYIVNAPDETDVAKWYRDTMPKVKGETGITIDDMVSGFLSADFLQAVEEYKTGQDARVMNDMSRPVNRYQLPYPKFFNDFIHLSFDVRRNSVQVKEAVIRSFGPPQGKDGSRKYYNISDIMATLERALNSSGTESCTEPAVETEDDDDELPY